MFSEQRMTDIDKEPVIQGPDMTSTQLDPSVHNVEVHHDEPGGSDPLVERSPFDPSKYSIAVQRLANDLEEEADRAAVNGRRFNRVVVICCFWEQARNLGYVKKNALRLGELLRSKFKFEVRDYEIPRNVSEHAFVGVVGGEVDKISEDCDSLFIFYYGGHATKVDDGPRFARTFQAEAEPGSPSVDWTGSMSTAFKRSKCQKLLIFDCCHAGSMGELRDPDDTLSCEVFGSCDAESRVSSFPEDSFTNAVIQELESSDYKVADLFTTLSSSSKKRKYNLKANPFHINYTSLPSVMLQMWQRPYSEPTMITESESDASILLKVRFIPSAEVFLQEYDLIRKQWKQWAHDKPSSVSLQVVEKVKLEHLYDSDSCIAIFTVPLSLWGGLARHPYYEYLGVARSHDYINPERVAGTPT